MRVDRYNILEYPVLPVALVSGAAYDYEYQSRYLSLYNMYNLLIAITAIRHTNDM